MLGELPRHRRRRAVSSRSTIGRRSYFAGRIVAERADHVEARLEQPSPPTRAVSATDADAIHTIVACPISSQRDDQDGWLTQVGA